MNVRLTATPDSLVELHWLLLAADDGIELPAGLARSPVALEFLLPGPADRRLAGATVRAFRMPPGLEGCSHLYWHAFPRPERKHPHLELALHDGRGCSAAAFVHDEVLPVAQVLLAGAGMDRWTPAVLPPDLRGGAPSDGRHSRYAGALGGTNVHDRLRAIACLGIASARLGSAMTVALAKAGCAVVTVDPDVLEPHSEDAVECFPADRRSRWKAVEVARFAATSAPWTTVRGLPVAANAPEALAAARNCRLVFSAPDRDDARFCASLLAVAFHRVHVDLGTGVFEEGGRWRAGADVRLLLPGQGCLLCVGGLDLAAAPPADWRRQRAGSLRSLNHLAVNAAMLLVERLVAGGLSRSTWTRVEVDEDGTFTTRRMPVARARDCRLCGRWAGAGDGAFAG